ncbi:MAG: hypothetical protein C0501_31005 [Isosphaera sp.]|nr:hypothetical protein [Isosphaera sp.]
MGGELRGPIPWADAGGSLGLLDWWAGWNADPVVLLNLALVSWLYVRGVERLWRAGPGRGVRAWQAGAFAAGLVAVAAALVSPLDRLSDELASADKVQHMVLMNVATPLLVLGNPVLVLLSGMPAPYRAAAGRAWRRVDAGGRLWNPFLVWALYAAALWAWHHPVLYQAALRNPVVHDAQHLTFFAAACLFWPRSGACGCTRWPGCCTCSPRPCTRRRWASSRPSPRGRGIRTTRGGPGRGG